MKMDDLRKAGEARCRYERAKRDRDALDEMLVIGLFLGRHLDEPRPIELRHNHPSGTGSVSGIGFPSDLQIAMEQALKAWAEGRVLAAEDELQSFGIEIDQS
jgi:hypothetical protein